MPNLRVKSMEQRIIEFVKRVRHRNIRETLVSCALIVVFAYDLSKQREDIFSIIGSGVLLLGLLLIITVIWWKLHIPKSEVSAFPPTQFPDKWKNHLTNQARMLRLIWLWYLLPLFSGVCIYLSSVYDTSSGNVVAPLLIVVAVFAGTWWLNLQAAKQIERDRDAWFGNSRAA